jgi:hypothetical protein
MTMNRHIRRRAAMLGIPPTVLLALAGCATIESTLGMTPAKWATDLSLAAGWMPQIVSALAALGVPQTTLAQITKWSALVQTDAAAVSTATATVVVGTSSATYVQEAMQTLSAIAGVALPLLLPGGGALVVVVQAFLALVPELAAALGLTSASLVGAPMTIDAARAVLSQPH